MAERSYGQVAYEAYGDNRAWQTFAGDPMPRWDEQTEELRSAWTAAADAVADVTGVCVCQDLNDRLNLP